MARGLFRTRPHPQQRRGRTYSQAPSGITTAVLVVGNSGALTGEDTYLQGRLEAAGLTVTVVDDGAGADLTKGMVVIADSASATQYTTGYRNFAGPVLTFDMGGLDEMDMAPAVGSIDAGQSDVQVIDDAHEIPTGAGLTLGFHTLYTAGTTTSYVAITSLQVVARAPIANSTDANKANVFSFEAGDTMEASHVAEGRRAFVGLVNAGAAANGNAVLEDIVDAAILWLKTNDGGAHSIILGLISQTAATFTPTVSVGAVDIGLALINQASALFAPTVTPGTVSYAPALIDQTAVAFAPTITAGGVILGLIDQTAAPFAPVVTSVAGVVLGLISQVAVAAAPQVLASPTWTTPADLAGINALPELKFLIPDMGAAMHFNLQLDTADTFDTGDLRNVRSDLDQTGWDFWNGFAWEAVTGSGVSSTFAGNEARYTVQTSLTPTVWHRRVRAGT